MSFAFPDDARPWGQPHSNVEYDGVVLREFAFLDPDTRLGRVFWTTDDRRIFLLTSRYGQTPLSIQIDGEPVRRPLGMVLVYDVAAVAVETMRRRDGIHEALESEPDGED